MDHSTIRARMPSLVAGHIPGNIRRFKFRIYDNKPQESAFGFHIDPQSFEGKVIVKTEDIIVIKIGRAEFAVLDRNLVTQEPEEGTRVHVQPYVRRRFDGLRADTPEERIELAADGTPFVVKTHILGAAPAKLPLPELRCPELRELIRQLEQLPAPDGFRHITHLLVDAGAQEFTWVDPLPADIIKTPPALSFTVDTTRFHGRVTVLYERADDLYSVELHCGETLVERVDAVFFDTLGETLESLIDDGHWRQIQVDVISGKCKQIQH